MNELQLLSELNSLKQKQHVLELMTEAPGRQPDIPQIVAELMDIQNEISKIEKSLIEVDDKSYSKKAALGMVRQLNSYIAETSKAKVGLKLARNQGMVVENYLFGIILYDLKIFVTRETFGYHVPINLTYTYSDENSVEIAQVVDFLRVQMDILQHIENPNLIALMLFCDNFENELKNRFIKK
jgi:hypothetical protein